MKASKRTKVISILLAVLLVCGIFAGCAGANNSQQPSNGSSAVAAAVKNITVTVVHGDGTSKDFPIAAAGETLREALEQENLVEGEDGQYGLFIKTVDGETVDGANQEWWCLTKDGEMPNTGVDGVKIADGDVYELTFTVGY